MTMTMTMTIFIQSNIFMRGLQGDDKNVCAHATKYINTVMIVQ